MIHDREVPKWVERVRLVGAFYESQLRENPGYTLEELSKELKRSQGRLSEDLMLCKFMRTHPKVETFRNIRDAVDFCKKIKKERRMGV